MPKITEVWAFVMEDTGPDDEGIPAFVDQRNGLWVPLIAADKERLESLRPIAEEMAKAKGKPIKLLRASALEAVEVIEP